MESNREPATAALNAHGRPLSEMHGHGGCQDGGDLGPCDCLCHRDPPTTAALCDEPITKTAAEWGRELLAAERRVRARIAERISGLENGWGFWSPAFADACGKAAKVALDENEDYEPEGYIGGPEH